MVDRFRTTRWSLVRAAAGDDGVRAEALQWLCETYWYPLYGFVRRQGHDAESARDLTQSFFLTLLEKDALRDLDPQLGRFRAFLLAAMKHFLSHEREKRKALRRRADDPAFRFDFEVAEGRYLREPAIERTPEDLFVARWAASVLDRAVRRLGDEYDASGKGELFGRLRGHLTGEEGAYAGLAAALDMTEGALRVAVHRMRRRLGLLLREEVAQTVESPDEIDDEIRFLLHAIARAS
jgi:RNA polymerase sigma-70 factor (ECF subfamily)